MRSIKNFKPDWKDYFSTSLADFYARLDHRILVYAVVFVFSGLFTLSALWGHQIIFNQFYKSPPTFTGMYSWHTATNFTLSLFLMDSLFAIATGSWGTYKQRTVGKTWLVFLGAFAMAFAVQQTLVFQSIDLYAPKLILYLETYPAERPGAVAMLLYILPFWTATAYGVIRLILGMQARSEELLRVRVDTVLEERSHLSGRGLKTTPETRTDDDIIQLPTDPGVGPIRRSQIGHVSVEDHYLRIHFLNDGKYRDTLIRMTLKELPERLPSDQFIRIHRSHIINLEWVSGVKRMGRDVRLTMEHSDFMLPVSRYRLPQLLPVLDRFLEQAHSGRSCVAFGLRRTLQPSATGTSTFSERCQHLMERGLPFGLHASLCTLHLFCLL